jgi:cell division septum initiation protein DivIVA
MEQSQAQLRKFLERLPIEFSTAVDTSLAGFRGASRELSKDISDLLAASSEKMSAETRLRLETVVREHQAVIENATETLVTSLGNGPGQLYDAAATIVQQLNGVAGRIHASFESVRSQYLAQVDTLASDLERRVAENLTTALRGT